jgi:predicted nucleic acid-binding protein
MIVVSNTSPVINLAVVNHLNLLQQLYSKVVIPQAVYDEIVIEGAGQAGAEEVEQSEWIEVKPVANRPLVKSLESDLDLGEAEAVVLAVELKADLLLIDERKGRAVANRLGVTHIGLLGVLVQAKHNGLIPAVRPVMDSLMTQAGFWVSNELYEHILQVTGESE